MARRSMMRDRMRDMARRRRDMRSRRGDYGYEMGDRVRTILMAEIQDMTALQIAGSMNQLGNMMDIMTIL